MGQSKPKAKKTDAPSAYDAWQVGARGTCSELLKVKGTSLTLPLTNISHLHMCLPSLQAPQLRILSNRRQRCRGCNNFSSYCCEPGIPVDVDLFAVVDLLNSVKVCSLCLGAKPSKTQDAPMLIITPSAALAKPKDPVLDDKGG